jgi:hypothetical protein
MECYGSSVMDDMACWWLVVRMVRDYGFDAFLLFWLQWFETVVTVADSKFNLYHYMSAFPDLYC